MATDAWGIDDGWVDTAGRWQPASEESIEAIRSRPGRSDRGGPPLWVVRPGAAEVLHSRCHLTLEDGADLGTVDRLPPDLPLGLHDLAPLDGGPVTTLLVGPGRCHLPDDLRAWGVVVQVPTTRSRDSWGIGDLADVRNLATWLHELGAGFLALSPLHAPTPTSPIATSPYFALEPPLAQPPPPARRRGARRTERRGRRAGDASASRLLAHPHRRPRRVLAVAAPGARAPLGRPRPRRTGSASPPGAPSREQPSRDGRASAPSPSGTAPAGARGPPSCGTPTIRRSSGRRPRSATGSPSTPGCSSSSPSSSMPRAGPGPG